MNELENLTLELLERLEVNPNIRLFAEQWIEENSLFSLDDLFSLFDRLNLPYLLKSNLKGVREYKAILAISEGDSFVIGRSDNGGFVSLEEESLAKKVEFYIIIEDVPHERNPVDWVGQRLHAFKPIMPKLLLVSFVTNLFALSVPFITMSIYDHVIGGDAGHELEGIAIGALLLFIMMGWLRTLRSRVFASVSNRFSREIAESIVLKLLRSSYLNSQNLALSSQQGQLMMPERVAGLLSGPMGNALFDLPFIALFVIAIGVLGGWLVIVPMLALVLYYVLGRHCLNSQDQTVTQTTVAGTNRQNLTLELSSKLAFIQSAGLFPYWMKRFNKANTLASKNSFHQTVKQSKYTSLYYLINASATLSIMGLGIGLIFEEVLTPGGLIASMMLISRVTGPAQILANSAVRFKSYNQSKSQINRLMTQPSERDFSYQHQALPSHAPTLKLNQVTLRYSKQNRPALGGISVDIKAGEVVAVTGPTGSGKTSLLDVISGLQPIQNGLVELEGVNLSQYDPQLYRHWCFIRAAFPDLLTLSVREWLADGHEVSDQKMLWALEQVGGREWVTTLPDGLDTKLHTLLPESFYDVLSGSVAQILIDAKALVYDYKLMILDNPVPDYHPQAKQVFERFVAHRKGKATIIFSTHDPELMKLADTVVVLDQGMVVYAGPLEQETLKQEATNEK